MDNEASDQTARNRRLIYVFIVRTCQKVLFLYRSGSINTFPRCQLICCAVLLIPQLSVKFKQRVVFGLDVFTDRCCWKRKSQTGIESIKSGKSQTEDRIMDLWQSIKGNGYTFKGHNSVSIAFALPKRIDGKRKECASTGCKFFPFRVNLFSEVNSFTWEQRTNRKSQKSPPL